MRCIVGQLGLSKSLLHCPAKSGGLSLESLPHWASNTVRNEGRKGIVLGNFSGKWLIKGPAWPHVPARVGPHTCMPGRTRWAAENIGAGLTQSLETTQALPGILGSQFGVWGWVTQQKKRAAVGMR